MPLNLITTIQADATLNSAFLAEDDATLLAGLNAKTVQEPVTTIAPEDLVPRLSAELVETLLTVLKTMPRFKNLSDEFRAGVSRNGIDFTKPLTQMMLSLMEQHPDWPADATAKLESLAVKVMSPTERDHGDGVTAMQEDITFTRDTWIREGVAAWARGETERVINEHVTGGARDVTTRAAFKAAMRE